MYKMDITNKNLLYKKINKIKFKKKSSGKLNSKARKGRKSTICFGSEPLTETLTFPDRVAHGVSKVT